MKRTILAAITLLLAITMQAWLFWGNNGCWYAKLNEDIISIDKSFANNGICDMRHMAAYLISRFFSFMM